jgi:hypothetical protein
MIFIHDHHSIPPTSALGIAIPQLVTVGALYESVATGESSTTSANQRALVVAVLVVQFL